MSDKFRNNEQERFISLLEVFNINVCVLARLFARVYACLHPCVRARVYACVRPHVYVCVRVCACMCVGA